jgi:hypothetical protein
MTSGNCACSQGYRVHRSVDIRLHPPPPGPCPPATVVFAGPTSFPCGHGGAA